MFVIVMCVCTKHYIQIYIHTYVYRSAFVWQLRIPYDCALIAMTLERNALSWRELLSE